jgi:polysaccharide biosynthesis transport protein
MNSTLTDTTASLPGRAFQPLNSLHNQARLVGVMFFVVALLGLPLVFIMGQPSYQSTATLQVSPRYMKNLRDDIELEFQSNTQFLQFIEQQARTVNRYDVVELALEQLNASGQKLWHREGESDRRAIERLQGSLAIRHVRNTYLLQVSLVTDEPEGVDKILNAVIAAFLDRAREEQVFAADERVESLKQREQDLIEQIEAMTTERMVIGQELGFTYFNPDNVNPFDIRTRQLQGDYQQARVQRIEAQSRLNAFLIQGETDTSLPSIQQALLTDPGLNSLKASLNMRRAELLTSTSGLSSTHPATLDAQLELARIEQEINSREAELRERLSAGVESRYRTSTYHAGEVEAQLEQMLGELTLQSGAYAEGFNRAVSLTNHLQLLWSELDSVRERLNFFEAEETSPGFTRLVTAALPPLYPTGTGKKKLLLMVLVVAAALSLATPIVIDLFDSRIRTVNDAHRTLGFAPLSWIINAEEAEHKLFAEDQLRRLASGLIRDGNRHNTRHIVITSVRPGGGTTWIARSLTSTLNRLGFPAVVIEANAFRPDAVYGTGNGLAAALAGDGGHLDINMADPNIPSLPVGSSDDTLSLGNLQRLPAILSSLSQDYRFVIVDAPPLLSCADAELIVGAGDAVLLVAEAGSISKGELSRAGRLLKNIDPPVVGTIVNRIHAFHGGGYVDSLVAEHHSGQKAQPASLVPALKATGVKLMLAPVLVITDGVSSLIAVLRRKKVIDAHAATQEER